MAGVIRAYSCKGLRCGKTSTVSSFSIKQVLRYARLCAIYWVCRCVMYECTLHAFLHRPDPRKVLRCCGEGWQWCVRVRVRSVCVCVCICARGGWSGLSPADVRVCGVRTSPREATQRGEVILNRNTSAHSPLCPSVPLSPHTPTRLGGNSRTPPS